MERPVLVDLNELDQTFSSNVLQTEQYREELDQEYNREVIPEGTFYAPQFFLQKGAELGYHCHVYRTIGEKDLGLMVTMVGDKVFVESHRVGKVKKSYSIYRIGKKDLEELVYQAKHQLADTPDDAKRQPSKKAICIGTYQKIPTV
jgi:hypothetical protein